LAAQKKYPENSIHVCLNGDIDNYLTLKKELEKNGTCFDEDITTDTKIIPLQIQKYLQKGNDVAEAFRLAVNDFEGSHAISMHTDLAPGTIFLAQKGSGQAIFVGLAKDHYMATSEVYGFIEETPLYLKMDGERMYEGKTGKTQGQIFILSQSSTGDVAGITAMHYDGAPLTFQENCQMRTDITSRDIDRQNFPHYFIKEISESPLSVERTLQNRWKIAEDGSKHHVVVLDEKEMPQKLKDALIHQQIKRIFFIGQGTAGVAALACANILSYYMKDPSLYVGAIKASEFSGFMIDDNGVSDSMSDTLVVAMSQSGTTTDTNRTIDMIRVQGAYTLAIVNRRDSDITFKVDGVIYTSSGRDIEMSVASTKAFYAQIVAGAMLGLYITGLKNRRTETFISEEIKQLLEIPHHMKSVLKTKHLIEKSANRLAVSKTYWAAVGSGPNKVAADEIRIKLSELCYKTISSDYVEDKKHIDLSSEPLIFVCASGTKGTVIGDIVKDTAIFHAHKATPVVIADENEHRFDAYAEDVFHVPAVSQHLAPILNTLVGHIWGYYAALAINEGSRFFYRFRENIQKTIDEHVDQGLDIYEIVLEKSFREKIAYFYTEFRKKRTENRLPTTIGLDTASDLPILLKYLSGRLPVTDFELDFGCKGTAKNMIKTLYKYLGGAINHMARPVDAIKHQAKTVTVGTSRIPEKVEGLLFDSLSRKNFNVSHLTNKNVIVLKHLQSVIDRIKGSVLYQIDALNLLGEPTERTTIKLNSKDGSSSEIRSRVEDDNQLKGTKRIIVREGNAYIGKGRKDDRSILIIPIISASPDKPNVIEYLYLLNISFQTDVSLKDKIKALGGKYESIKNIVQENSLTWDESHLESIEIEELFGRSAEKIGESIVAHFSQD
jgi:glucosamine--fructose-6-phosphate aminotransferase (isomerizing)